MSLGEVQRFYQKIRHDFDFFQLFTNTLQAIPNDYREQIIHDFAKEQGFDVSMAECKHLVGVLEHSDLRNNSSEAKLSVNKLERLFIWLSGVSPGILATCPESEQKKHAALGGTVLIPALLAIVTASFLLYTLNFSTYIIVPVALLWSCMILLMDRALLATYRKGFSFLGKLGQFSLRFAIALLIAVTVAHPVVLLLFSERIDAAYNEGRIKTERDNLALQCDLKNPQSELRLLDEKMVTLRSELKNSNQLFEPAICNDSALISSQDEIPAIEKLNQELDILKAKKIQAEQDAALFIDNAEKEKQGTAGTGFTGVSGCKKGTQCKKWLSQASDRKDDSIRLGKGIVALEGQISQLNEKSANQLIEIKQASKKQCEKERDELKTTRVKQRDLDQKGIESLSNQQQLMSRRCVEKEAVITNLKPDVLTQTEILNQLIFPDHSISWHNLLIFLIFMLLFLAIDMLAVVLKMARSGVYEAKVDMAETHDLLLEFINQRHQAVLQFTEIASQEQTIIENLNINMLKQGLDGNLKNLIQLFAKSDSQKLDHFFKD
ncbi:DUF4407 domain-containing protein [Methylobacter sp. S3L5C]|uniref:DUF4407 domain-containing protein n=1 Tax=Methylobacter sp. S3L5C TaxID=2839024 RepID=UPI001FAD44AD|nr:DUF4407 domain-containing protein [Methylobacter sp. S3L5C]UOA07089.1 DUF4407 domain-containing protein [Methylobacter sp. S3L5C]